MFFVTAVIGALAGMVTGLVPGIHVNTITALLLASSAGCAVFGVGYPALLSFTCAIAVSHTFFSVVPGLFLGVPGDTVFALLPGHRLVLRGEGKDAIRLSVAGSAIGLLLGIFLVAAALSFGNALGAAQRWLNPWMFLCLAAVSAVLIFTDRNRWWSLTTFLASGALGVAVFGSPLVAGGTDAPVNVLFPSLAGLFGVAGLLFAIGTAGAPRATAPPKEAPEPRSETPVVAPGVRGGAAGLLVGLLPGLGAANAATLLLLVERFLGRRRAREEEDRAYLVTTSSLNTAEALFAIAALYLIGRTRSGASVAVERILGGVVQRADLLPIALSMLVAGALAAWMLLRFGGRFAARLGSVNEVGLNCAVVVFLVVLVRLLLGGGGLVILGCATAVGMLPLLSGARRAQLMGFFLVPTMLFYSGRERALVEWLGVGARSSPQTAEATLSGIVLAIAGAAAVAVAVYAAARRVRESALRTVLALTALMVMLVAPWRVLSGGAEPSAEPPEPVSEVAGRVVRVVDGDTATIDSFCRRYRVRFKGVDAPELGRPGGDRAKQWLAARIEGREVTWTAVGVDVYGRVLGEVRLPDGVLVNAEIIELGYAKPWEAAVAADPEPPADERPAPPAAVARFDDDGNGRITCAEARRHGIAPVRSDHPAYRFMSDGDGDGVVCE